MTPQELSKALREIAAKLDRSFAPSRALVAGDLKKLVHKMAVGPEGHGPDSDQDVEEDLTDPVQMIPEEEAKAGIEQFFTRPVKPMGFSPHTEEEDYPMEEEPAPKDLPTGPIPPKLRKK